MHDLFCFKMKKETNISKLHGKHIIQLEERIQLIIQFTLVRIQDLCLFICSLFVDSNGILACIQGNLDMYK